VLRRLDLHRRWSTFSQDGVRLEEADIDLSDLDLQGIDLSGAVLLGVRFDRSNLRGANLSRALITKSSMRDVDLSDADLYKAEIDKTALTNACLLRAVLEGMEAGEVDLRSADLSGSRARGFSCWRSDLRGTLLRDLRLDCTAFEDCMMAGVDLAGASGSIDRGSRIDVGEPDRPEVLEGEALLAWFRRSGATLTWCNPSMTSAEHG
jgi:uncharacterized protein YjbI with pentapeptide repeats